MILKNLGEYQTDSISQDAEIGVDPFTFTLQTEASGVVVTFEARWGLPASPEISHNGTLLPTVSGE